MATHRRISETEPESTDGAHAFPSTHWSRLVADTAAGSDGARRAFDALARSYWRPIAAYARARLAGREEDALDATQEFFAWMLETRLVDRLEPDRGSFRGFLKRCLANFLHDRERKRRTVKRGGAHKTVALASDVDESSTFQVADVASRAPEQALDDVWRREILARATEALEAELRERGKEATFAVFRDYFLSPEELDYEAVAARHGITKVGVSNRLTYAKKRYRAHLRLAILETVGDDDALRRELAWLFERGPE